MRKVVVTGMGVLTSVGDGVDEFWASLKSGKSGITEVTRFDCSDIASKVASEINSFNPEDFMDPKEVRRNDRYAHLALAATHRALTDANLSREDLVPDRTGVLVGSGIGGMETIEKQMTTLIERGPRRVSPFMIPSLIANIAGGVIAIDLGAQGPNFSVVSACASMPKKLKLVSARPLTCSKMVSKFTEPVIMKMPKIPSAKPKSPTRLTMKAFIAALLALGFL